MTWMSSLTTHLAPDSKKQENLGKTAGVFLYIETSVRIMIESAISASIAVITGGFVLTNRIYRKIDILDKRIDQIELSMAQDYVTKSELVDVLDRIERQMLRVETKLDKLIIDR